jgi:hypothetical protein
MDNPIFISYAHADRPAAERLARSLMDQGQAVWWDQWEIAAGDSLIRKIFAEGIAKAGAFVILLSPTSVASKWVQDELDSATVRRIEDLTRVIPALVEDVPIPMPLRTLRWVDLQKDFDGSVRQIVNAVNQISEKPPLGSVPRHVALPVAEIRGLSKLATQVGRYVLSENDPDAGAERALDAPDLAGSLHLTPQEVNDAVDELENAGLVSVIRALGTHPFEFVAVEPTYLLFQEACDQLEYDPNVDIRKVIVAVASADSADGSKLSELTALSAGRLNRAVEYLRDNGLVNVIKFLGTHPFSFGLVTATRRTRQAAERT